MVQVDRSVEPLVEHDDRGCLLVFIFLTEPPEQYWVTIFEAGVGTPPPTSCELANASAPGDAYDRAAVKVSIDWQTPPEHVATELKDAVDYVAQVEVAFAERMRALESLKQMVALPPE